MEISNDLLSAAQELGTILAASPVVQEYLQAHEALIKNSYLQQLEVKIEQTYEEFLNGGRDGEMFNSERMEDFYDLQVAYSSHPLVIQHSRCERALKDLFGEIGGMISSILSVDYTQLAVG